MAINIIKQPATFFTIECAKCSCEFTYETEDLQEDKNFKGASYAVMVFCPVCKTKNWHNFRKKRNEREEK